MPTTRHLAVMALIKILGKSEKPKETMDALSRDSEKRERAFLMELVYGVLRYRDYIDWMLKDFLKKPSGLSPYTLNNLRTGIYQIVYTRVPDRAAVHEAVDMEKLHGSRSSLVNAVLRGFLRQRDAISPPSKADPSKYISITTSHPEWLVQRWLKLFGFEEALKIAEANNVIPPFVLRAACGPDRQQLLTMLNEKGADAHLSNYSPVGIVIDGACSFQELEIFAPLTYTAQDEAAQLVSYLLNPEAGEKVLDACAAPGGKTTHMAELMQDSGEIVAVESEQKRIRQLDENISRLGLKSIRIVHDDVKTLSKEYHSYFDKILLDAPCSSIGVIRRNPDVRYRHTPKDMLTFGKKQIELLTTVSRFLRTGGSMVYSVCSTEPEEGEDVIKEFLHNNTEFSIIGAVQDFLKPFEIREGNYLFYRTYPHRHNMDGFFAVKMKRTR